MAATTTAPTAQTLLEQIAGAGAEFRTDQREAIAALVTHRRRVLLVQRTGWGKSAVYFIATRLLREQGAGPTLLISPLLALMRNQIEMAARAGVRAATINSANTEQWEQIDQSLNDDAVDLLLVSPERLNNPRFREQLDTVIAPRAGLLVVDEAHCISDWGHDFRPDYRRVRRMLDALPAGTPVLCTTATANDRVVGDIREQLGADLLTMRGTLERSSLVLQVIALADPALRLAWLADNVEALPGSGIIYCLTIADTERVASWLRSRGLDAQAYSGATDAAEREDLEQRLIDNDLKALVATSALGMGYDKPDLGFVIHYQAPGSPIAYYQQVGRAGRKLERAFGVLLCGHEDVDIQDYFITTAFPAREQAECIVEMLANADAPVALHDIQREVNLGTTRLQTAMKVLEVENAVEQAGSAQRWRRTGLRWSYDQARVTSVTAARRREQQAMRNYIGSKDCLMAFLRRELDDDGDRPCGRCANCAGPTLPTTMNDELAAAAADHLRHEPLQIGVRKQWPAGLGLRTGRIPAGRRTEDGRALCRAGRAGWATLVARGATEGRFDDRLITAARNLIVRRWDPEPPPQWVTWIPSTGQPGLVEDFARRLAAALVLPAEQAVRRVRQRPSQRTRRNSIQQAANVLDAFDVRPQVPAQPVLLVDDLVDSGWTITVVADALRAAGVGPIHPFALVTAARG